MSSDSFKPSHTHHTHTAYSHHPLCFHRICCPAMSFRLLNTEKYKSNEKLSVEWYNRSHFHHLYHQHQFHQSPIKKKLASLEATLIRIYNGEASEAGWRQWLIAYPAAHRNACLWCSDVHMPRPNMPGTCICPIPTRQRHGVWGRGG